MDFMPIDQEMAIEFENKMAKNLLYRSTDNFITIYNNNLINRNNPEIDSIAKAIVDIYKNISLVSRQFIVKSKEEVVAEEFEVLFPHISFVATLKRISKDILSDNYPEDTLLVFTESTPNIVHIYDPSSITDELKVYEGAERLRSVNAAIATNPFLQAGISMSAYGEDGISFKAADVLTLDTSFITEIGELLALYTSKPEETEDNYTDNDNQDNYNNY